LGLADRGVRQARGITVLCPWHDERKPSCSITVGEDGTIRVCCFGCGMRGDVLHLIAQVRGLESRRDFKRVLEEAAQLAGIKLDEYRPPTPTQQRPARAAPMSAGRPPAVEVAELWASCVAVYDDSEMSGALCARAIDPAHVTDRDLARALPKTADVPAWARCGRWSWSQLGNRLIIPMFDESGQIVTLHARRLDRPGQNTPKGLSPKGFSSSGSVFADGPGRCLLAGRQPSSWTSRALVVSEGVPDFLTVATHYGDAAEDAPPVLGVISGSFNRAIAARVPDDSTVILRTHHDHAGNKYAAVIARTLGPRCKVLRTAADTEGVAA